MKIKLVAIAKDEAAYLPEWIFHHLSIGVDQINIHLNNISDFSHLMLLKISEKYKVNFFDSDDVKFNSSNDTILGSNFLANNPLQSRVYAKEYIESSNDFDYIIYLDIDEFLFVDKENVKEYILDKQEPELIKIKWLNETCDDNEFSFYKKAKLTGYSSNATKCIIKTNIQNIKFQSTHQIITHDNSKRYLEGYGSLENRVKSKMQNCFNNKVYIHHRAYRSEMEYVSLLLRGDNISNTKLGLKDNRPGRINRNNIMIESSSVEETYNEYLVFIRKCQIDYDLVIAREFVKKRYDSVEKLINELANNVLQSKKVLNGTKLLRLLE